MAGKKRLTEAEKEQRKRERTAQAMTARAKRDVGPLFEHLAPTFTATEAYWHWRRNKALAAENLGDVGTGRKPLDIIKTNWIEHHARQAMGAERFETVKARALKTFGDYYGYAYTFWAGIMTGQESIGAYVRTPDPTCKLGFRATPAEVIKLDPPPFATKAEFYAAFPFKDPDPLPEPDDGGQLDRLLALFTQEPTP